MLKIVERNMLKYNRHKLATPVSMRYDGNKQYPIICGNKSVKKVTCGSLYEIMLLQIIQQLGLFGLFINL